MGSTGLTRPWAAANLLSCLRTVSSYMSTFGALVGQLGNQTSILSAAEGMLAPDPGLVVSPDGQGSEVCWVICQWKDALYSSYLQSC